jgi:hypothetical protein
MSQQSSNPTPTTDAGQQQQKMPYGGRDGNKVKTMTDDPQTREALKALFLAPGMGLGTTTWDPQTGIRREQQRKMARGMSAQERMKILTDAGVTDRDGMRKVFERAYAPAHQALMLGKERK